MEKQKADSILTEYLAKIYGFAVKKSFSYSEAEDLCADIIEEVYVSLLKAKEVMNIEGYIWRISEHTYAKYVSSKKKQEGVSIDGLVLPFFDEYSLGEAEDELLRLRREIAFLTKKRRKIVYLFYYKNKSVLEISKAMGIPEGTVKWHLNKARHELKEGFSMQRQIGKLGLSPITAIDFGHNGYTGNNEGPEYYLGDKLNLNIVYSVAYSPKTREEIAEELGITPVYIEDKIDFLEGNGFLVKTTGNRYTTYVQFVPEAVSHEMEENKRKMRLEIADMLAKQYVPLVREAMSDVEEVYIPGGNRELFEAAAIFYGVANKCGIPIHRDLSNYVIKTTAGGEFIAGVYIRSEQCGSDCKPEPEQSAYWACGDMTRGSQKYPAVYAWSIDSRLSSRKGTWQNNRTSDYEYLYEFLSGMICDNPANAEKFARLKERAFLTKENQVNIMVVKGNAEDFFAKIPALDEKLKEKFAGFALESAMQEAKFYPPQMQDYVIYKGVSGFIGTEIAIMVMDLLYSSGTFHPLSDNEKVTSNLLMFSDILP